MRQGSEAVLLTDSGSGTLRLRSEGRAGAITLQRLGRDCGVCFPSGTLPWLVGLLPEAGGTLQFLTMGTFPHTAVWASSQQAPGFPRARDPRAKQRVQCLGGLSLLKSYSL